MIKLTIEEFANNNDVKRKTVIKWIEQEYIPGANIENNYIPNRALPPYSEARARTSKAIYKSILDAVRKRRYVLPKLYNITQEEFDVYIEQLEKEGLIEVKVFDNIEYYYATYKLIHSDEEDLKKTIRNILRIAVTAIPTISTIAAHG